MRWNYCCENQKVIFERGEQLADGESRKIYRCQNCRMVHREYFDKDSNLTKRRTNNIPLREE
jgi:hypothetical protein